MRQCCNSAASKDASGATARLVAGGGVLIIRANTRLCLYPQISHLPLIALVYISWSTINQEVICYLQAYSQPAGLGLAISS